MHSTTQHEGTNVRFSCITRPAKGEREADTPEWFVNGDPIAINSRCKIILKIIYSDTVLLIEDAFHIIL